MANNIITYAESEFSTFDAKPFSEVDSLVLSQLTYMYFDGFVCGIKGLRRSVRLKELYLAENFASMFKGISDTEDDRRLFAAVCASPRFRDLALAFCVDELDYHVEKQFSAITFFCENNFAYIAFRGTDSTMLGWKEDFHMAFKAPIPAQLAALEYLTSVARRTRLPLMVGGHSKGGNLAVYSASMASDAIKRRITEVFSHDGPGFMPTFFENSGYFEISDRVGKTIPQGSIVGLLLDDDENYTVIKSSVSGLMQHSPFTWIVEDGKFVVLDRITEHAHYIDRTLDEWIKSLSLDEMESMSETIYTVLNSANITPVDLAMGKFLESLPAMVNGLRGLTPEARGNAIKLIKRLTSFSIKNVKKKKAEN